jgi:hypothetical protein
MAGEGLESVEITGRWVGFYRYASEQMGAFPITAEIRQEGDRITGEMYDQITRQSNFLEVILKHRREEFSPSTCLQIEYLIRQFGDEDIVVNSQLPDTSDLDGKVTGDRVDFTKSYRGSEEQSWTVGGEVIGASERPRHTVRYSGHIDREKGCIVGGWAIRRQGFLGRFLPPLGRGTFDLYHKA